MQTSWFFTNHLKSFLAEGVLWRKYIKQVVWSFSWFPYLFFSARILCTLYHLFATVISIIIPFCLFTSCQLSPHTSHFSCIYFRSIWVGYFFPLSKPIQNSWSFSVISYPTGYFVLISLLVSFPAQISYTGGPGPPDLGSPASTYMLSLSELIQFLASIVVYVLRLSNRHH